MNKNLRAEIREEAQNLFWGTLVGLAFGVFGIYTVCTGFGEYLSVINPFDTVQVISGVLNAVFGGVLLIMTWSDDE